MMFEYNLSASDTLIYAAGKREHNIQKNYALSGLCISTNLFQAVFSFM